LLFHDVAPWHRRRRLAMAARRRRRTCARPRGRSELPRSGGRSMRPAKPRVEPLPESEWTDEARATIAPARATSGGKVFNIFSTLAHRPGLLKRWMVFANHVLVKSTLPARERELLILRIGWLCRAEYEFSQHMVIGRAVGLTDEEIDRIVDGPDAP